MTWWVTMTWRLFLHLLSYYGVLLGYNTNIPFRVLYNCTVLYSTDLLSVLPACMYRECTMILPYVPVHMTYGRCTIGMVPYLRLPYLPTRYDCHVLCYARTTVHTWNSMTVPTQVPYCCTTDSPVCTTLLMALYWYLRTTPYVVFILPTTLFIIPVGLPLLYGTYVHMVGYYLDYEYTMTVCHVPNGWLL